MNYLTIIIHLLKNIFGIFRLISILIFEVYMITGCNPKSGNESSIKHLRVEPEFHFIPAGITQLTGGILADRCDININNLYLAIESRYGTPIRFTKIKFQEKPLLLEVNTQKDATIPQVLSKTTGSINDEPETITLVDYSSAGSINAGKDEFRVWIPVMK